MKIKDILKESCTDLVAYYYKDSDETQDINSKYKDIEKQRYEKYFSDGTPVFRRVSDFIDKNKPWTTNAELGQRQSAGYRGIEHVKQSLNIPYDKNVQNFNKDELRQN